VKIHQFNSIPNEWNHRLLQFESGFSYPLGETQRFIIDHSPDYGRFYQSLGEEATFLFAEEKSKVIGGVALVLRVLVNSFSESRVWYLGDLKVIPTWRGTRMLLKLAFPIFSKARAKCPRAIGIVMDEMNASNKGYKPNIGQLFFKPLGKIYLWSLPTTHLIEARDTPNNLEFPNALACQKEFYTLIGKTTTLQSGDSNLRSQYVPQWLSSPKLGAVGRLEDTLLAKRLTTIEGNPIRTAHLANFAYTIPEEGIYLLQQALTLAKERGFESLMVSLSESYSKALEKRLYTLSGNLATATIYGLNVPQSSDWHVNSSEI
jgi:hypothetical protein